MRGRILVVDDERAIGIAIQRLLGARGHEVDAVLSGEDALRRLAEPGYHLVITDLSLQGVSGMDVLRWVRERAPETAVMMITAFGSEKIAGEAMKRGAADYITKPLVKVNCAAFSRELVESELFGHEKGACTGAVAAREGKFEIADGGTLFLDEIGDMRPETQAKILRVLQEREFERVGGNRTLKVDVRVLAATNQDLEANVKAGSFREDLYYRLNVVSIALPALCERVEDLPLLIDHFLGAAAARLKREPKPLSPDAYRALCAHEW